MAKKLLSAVLALLMVMALVPMSVLAKGETQTRVIRYEETDTIETGVDYLIGYQNGSDVYLVMNSYGNSTYLNYNSNYFLYGIKAVLDTEGRITAVDPETTYSNVSLDNVKVRFATEHSSVTIPDGKYAIQSQKTTTNYLKGSSYSANSYIDTQFTSLSSTYGVMFWSWDSTEHQLTVSSTRDGEASPFTRYLQYYGGINTSYPNLFATPCSDTASGTYASSYPLNLDNTHLKLYKAKDVTPSSYTLTIKYTFPEGHVPAGYNNPDTYTQTESHTFNYTFDCPKVSGYEPIITCGDAVYEDGDTITVDDDKLVNVTYSPTLETALKAEGSEPITFANDPDHAWSIVSGTGPQPLYAKITQKSINAASTSSTITASFEGVKDQVIKFDYLCYGSSYYGTLTATLKKDGTAVDVTGMPTNYQQTTSNSSWQSIEFALSEAGSYTLEFTYTTGTSTYYYDSYFAAVPMTGHGFRKNCGPFGKSLWKCPT